MISFIIYFSSTRLANLLQTLRFLEKREPLLLDGELLLICQDRCPSVASNFKTYKHFNLELSNYRKPYMCNLGVKNATHENIVLLDSDRILPESYFSRCLKLLKENMAITTVPLYQLKRTYSDSEIELKDLEKKSDFRSKENEGGRKNLFAGNTLMKKIDYLKWGGMDEEFVGYGFADMDMTTSVMKQGCTPLYLEEEEELHLYHYRETCLEGRPVDPSVFRIITATNALRYCVKWKTLPNEGMKKIIQRVNEHIDEFPEGLRNKYENMKREIQSSISL